MKTILISMAIIALLNQIDRNNIYVEEVSGFDLSISNLNYYEVDEIIEDITFPRQKNILNNTRPTFTYS